MRLGFGVTENCCAQADELLVAISCLDIDLPTGLIVATSGILTVEKLDQDW